MSVKLIVVALLAAAAATGRAAGEDATTANTLVIKTCPANTVNCDCATPESTKTYTVGKCTTADGKHWKVDACDANVVKAYTSDTCANATLTLQKACRAVNYHRAECEGTTVKLYAGCNSDQCEKKDGDSGCKTPTTFTIGEEPPKCLKAGNKYYKLTSSACPASEETQSVSFTQYLQKDCTDKGESVTVPTTCAATGYEKVSCAADGVSVEACTSASCDASGCTVKKILLKEYTKIDSGDYLYIDKCPGDADPVVFNVYADVMKYELGCHGLVNAICGEKSGSDSGSNSSGSGSDSGSNSSGSGSDSGSNSSGSNSSGSNGSDSDSGAETTNETTNTTSTGVIAPAHTVGVLALALCLLACLY